MTTETSTHPEIAVTKCTALGWSPLRELLHRYGLDLRVVDDGADIPGSYWGAPEAGLLGRTVLARGGTPVHSLLHETCHLICMDEERRVRLDTEAGGEDIEEDATCYLQIVLADQLPGVGAERLMADMDAWGYSFRLGSTSAWFAGDAGDARDWLLKHRLITPGGNATFALRS